jgi:YidC/Oxa1 family membrane protein insertase
MPEYQHRPEQGPMNEKSFFLYLALAFVLVVLMRPLLVKEPPAPGPKTVPVINKPAPQATPATTATPHAASSAVSAKHPPVPAKQAAAETEVVAENDIYRITFTNRGAQVKSWVLKKYKDEKGNPLDLVSAAGAQQAGLPLSLWTYDESLRQKLNSVLYAAPPQGNIGVPGALVMEYADQETVVRKSFTFDRSYVIQVEVSVTQNGNLVEAYPAWPSGFGDQTTASTYATSRLDYRTMDDVHRQPASEHHFWGSNHWVIGGNTIAGPFYWAGLADQYFGVIFMPAETRSAAMVTLHQEIDIPRDANKPEEKDHVHVLGVAVGNTGGTTRENLFVGPKALDVLDVVKSFGRDGAPRQGPDLEGIVDFGFFGIFAKWLFQWLNWTHDHLAPNWGWAIALLTLIINVALLPLRFSSMKNALKMQKIQPQMKSIQDKYSKYGMRDPRRAEMQKEIWALQKQEGVSMTSGCLPMLLQLPFLWAFYSMLANTIELRQAGWLWIHDLSAADPWHILPMATIITMLWLQQMTPQAGMDPAQRRMMNIMMPIMFGAFTWTVGAGLALYWSVSNVINGAQQFAMNRTSLGREIREIQEKRARKRNR